MTAIEFCTHCWPSGVRILESLALRAQTSQVRGSFGINFYPVRQLLIIHARQSCQLVVATAPEKS
jgi:hypothetical protein